MRRRHAFRTPERGVVLPPLARRCFTTHADATYLPSPAALVNMATFRQAFQQHCEYVRTPRGVVLQPMASLGVDKWLVIFCDEINLPEQVHYIISTHACRISMRKCLL